MLSQIALSRCDDYSNFNVKTALEAAISLLGGIDKFVKPGSKVLIKPNLLAPCEPESGIVTHPEIIRALIHLLKGIDAHIYVGDSPSVFYDEPQQTKLIWEKSGIERVAQEEGVELVRFSQSRWRGKFPLTTWLDKVDYLISVPKFKTHDLTLLTGAIKNLFGLIPGRYKLELHKKFFTPEEFSGMLADLYEAVKPDLTIVDAVVVLEGEGPSGRGKKKDLGFILSGVDCVSIDSILSSIMGLEPGDILSTQAAARRKMGNARLEEIDVLGELPGSFRDRQFKLPKTTFKYRLPRPIISLIRKLVRFYPCIDSGLCSRCGACISTCPQKIIVNNGREIKIEHSGCIFCFCCREVCPNAAISIKTSLIARLFGL
ncbi:MAG: DUF362 domain-containing protein [Candidatus Omnitrophica bacterium]|nr:DUF362 domain-containing protein [Candidatus Omnitrophota bacterium]